MKLREIKENMWKKSRQDGENQNPDNDDKTELENLENQLDDLESIIKRIENERAERIQRKTALEDREKEKRDKKKDRLELQKRLESKWEMIRWLAKYIDEHQDQWNIDRELRQEEITGEMSMKKNNTRRFRSTNIVREREMGRMEKEGYEKEQEKPKYGTAEPTRETKYRQE